MHILVTNDDGIDSEGLHVLARAMRAHGEVTVVAPDRENSGAGAAIGALHLMEPEIHPASVDGIDTAWKVNGTPALCAMFARMGAFGAVDVKETLDLRKNTVERPGLVAVGTDRVAARCRIPA